MILCIGEILVDTYLKKGKTSFFVGGAPFNVCYTINRLGYPTQFVGNIADDEEGKFILDFCAKKQIDTSYFHIIEGKKTTISKASSNKGENTFTFLRGVDDEFDENVFDLLSKASIIHIGSLMLSTQIGFDFAKNLIAKAKSLHKVISFDINYRKDIYPNSDIAKKRYQEIIPSCDIVKFSREELSFFTEEKDLDKSLLKLIGHRLIVVTLGKQGSLAYCKGNKIEAKSIKVEEVDTIGAGDAFFGTLLSQIDSFSFSDVMMMPSLLKSMLRFSNIVAALSTTKNGALNGIPTYQEAEAYLEKLPY